MQGTGWPVCRFRALSQLVWGEILGTKAKKKKKRVFCHFTWDKEIYSKNRAYFPVGRL